MTPFLPALLGYLLLFAALYAGFGVQSPYLPLLLQAHGLGPEAIGIVLAAGTAIRLAAGPTAGWLADRLDAARIVLAGCAAFAAIAALGYLPAAGFWPLLTVTLLQASALAPLAPLGDTLAVRWHQVRGWRHPLVGVGGRRSRGVPPDWPPVARPYRPERCGSAGGVGRCAALVSGS